MKSCYVVELSPSRIAVADLSDFDGAWWINRINVPNGFRGRGVGASLLQQILEEADRTGVILRLNINGYGDLSNHQLQEWYERHGFVETTEGYFERKPQ